MKGIICSLLVIILFPFPGTLRSQDASEKLDRLYGLDQTLCNGKKYDYFAPIGAKGHQFLLSPAYSVGSVTLKGTCYKDITLNYDVFNQQLLILYNDEKNALNIIEVSKAWLKRFSLGNRNFEFLNLDEKPRIYQVLGEGQVRILYYWRKNLEVEGSIGSFNLTFTHAIRDSYVLMDGHLRPFMTKRSLIGLFDPALRSEIKNYLRKHKVKVKKASDQAMAELIIYIGNIR